MTHLAVITDVHANLPALDAALAAIAAMGCDAIVHTGDAVGIGPFPAETLDRMLAVPRLRFVMGNHDAWLAQDVATHPPAWMDAEEVDHHRWVSAQVDPALWAVVAGWPSEIVGRGDEDHGDHRRPQRLATRVSHGHGAIGARPRASDTGRSGRSCSRSPSRSRASGHRRS
jgi:hypothetical protein